MRRLLFAILLLVPGAAFAQGAGFEITPTAGYRFTGSVTAYDDEGFRQGRDLKVDSGGAYGVTFDVPIGYRWQLEFLANHQSTSFQLDRGVFTPRTNLGDVDLDYYQVGLAYNWGRGQVNPSSSGRASMIAIRPTTSGWRCANTRPMAAPQPWPTMATRSRSSSASSRSMKPT